MIEDEVNMSKTKLDQMNNTIIKLTKMLQDKDNKIRQLTNEVSDNVAPTTGLVKKSYKFEEFSGTNDTDRKVIKLYSQGYSSGFIYEILNKELNTAISVNSIEKIIHSIEGDRMEIDNDLLQYFIECKRLFEDQQSLSKGLFASTIYKKLQILEENYSQCLISAKEMDDTKEQRMILDSILKLTKEKATIFSKNILDIFNNNSEGRSTHSEDYKNLREKYIQESSGKEPPKESTNIIKIRKKN